MRKAFICAALALSLTGCGLIQRTTVSTPPARCATLVPEGWSEGVEATPVPVTDGMSLLDQVKAWAAAYVGMGGQLAKANGRTVDAIGIVERCEALVNAARVDD